MKQMALSMILVMLLICAGTCICNQMTRSFYEQGIAMVVEDGIRHSLTCLARRVKEEPMTEDDLYAMFLEELVLQLGDQVSCSVEVYEISTKKGIMDLKVILDFHLPFGGKCQTTCRKRGTLERI